VIEARLREHSALRYFTGGIIGTLAGVAIWLIAYAVANWVFNLWYFEENAQAEYFRQFPLLWRYLVIFLACAAGGYVCGLISRDRVFAIIAAGLCSWHALKFSASTYMGWGFIVGTGSANSDIKLLSIAFLLIGFLTGGRYAERVIAQHYRDKGVPPEPKRILRPNDPALNGTGLEQQAAGEEDEDR